MVFFINGLSNRRSSCLCKVFELCDIICNDVMQVQSTGSQSNKKKEVFGFLRRKTYIYNIDYILHY